MNFEGAIIVESLQDTSVINELVVLETKVEPIKPQHKTPWLQQWTIITVEIPEEKAEAVAQKVSVSFDREHPNWYVDYKNEKHHFIIYSGKIFRVDLADPSLYADAKAYGISLGIPEYQVDFVPDDVVWDRG